MRESVDIDSYFQRIGYAGPRTATLETLASIHFLHPLAIPFEGLNAFLRRPVPLDLEALQRKMLRDGRGGWCFEQNLLLQHVLRALGLRVTGLAARVLWNAPEGFHGPRTHMLLRIDFDDTPYIADVGFGGLTLTGPLRLVAGIEQSTPHETFRLLNVDGYFVLQVLLNEAWKPLYSFDLQPQTRADYEVSSWYLTSHPESPFVNNLMVARATADRRYGLLNNKLSIHHRNGHSEQHAITSAAQLRTTLETTFAIRLPGEPALEAALHALSVPRRTDLTSL